MGSKCCVSCVKYLVFVVNLLVLLLGLSIFSLSLWLVVYDQIYADTQSVYIVYCVLLSFGAALLLTSFLGCCGAIRESQCLLSCFFTALLVFFVGEVVLTIYLYYKEEVVEEVVSVHVDATVRDKYLNATLTAKLWDIVQYQLECCGGDGPLDWEKSRYNGFQETREIGIGGASAPPFYLPPSCCRNRTLGDCASSVELSTDFSQQTDFYNQGCTQRLTELFKGHIFYILLLGLCILFIEFIGMFLSLCLCTTIRRINRWKP